MYSLLMKTSRYLGRFSDKFCADIYLLCFECFCFYIDLPSQSISMLWIVRWHYSRVCFTCR